MSSALELIRRCAVVPSFTTYEERLHPFVTGFAATLQGVRCEAVPERNLVLWTEGDPGALPFALTAHLDKINHLGRDSADPLPFEETDDELIGQLDDSVGLGICLRLLERLQRRRDLSLYVLLSEFEEGEGLRKAPHLLRPVGKDGRQGQGARHLSRWLIARGVIPKMFLTVDPTPLFAGESGIAVYSEHWRLNGLAPTRDLVERTETAVRLLEEINPRLIRKNNGNDYLVYGKEFNDKPCWHVPSLAVEPAIHPCHAMPERMLKKDIDETEQTLYSFITRLVHFRSCADG